MIPVSIYGATGLVGQRLVLRLSEHPLFTIHSLHASSRSAGLPYAKAVAESWLQEKRIPSGVHNIRISSLESIPEVPLVFSALGSEQAAELEPLLARRGIMVCSNASAHRMHAQIPLLIPEINAGHLDLVHQQPWPGRIVTNTNCAVAGLALTLAPLQRAYGLNRISAVTLQSISGAGLTGLPAMKIAGTVLPDIPGEAGKIAQELVKVLELDCQPAVQTWRVPISRGHSFSLDIELKENPSTLAVVQTLEQFSEKNPLNLHSSPDTLLVCDFEESCPNPSLLSRHHSMAVLVGEPRQWATGRFTICGCVDNLERGAAGAAVLNAELLHARGLLVD